MKQKIVNRWFVEEFSCNKKKCCRHLVMIYITSAYFTRHFTVRYRPRMRNVRMLEVCILYNNLFMVSLNHAVCSLSGHERDRCIIFCWENELKCTITIIVISFHSLLHSKLNCFQQNN